MYAMYPSSVGEMQPDIYTMELCDFLKPIIQCQMNSPLYVCVEYLSAILKELRKNLCQIGLYTNVTQSS